MSYISKIIISSFSTPVFLVFLVACAGYALGSVKIKGIELGTAGVFLAALLFGHFGNEESSLLHRIGLVTASTASLKSALSLIQNIGLICFVTSVGFIAGPNFFHSLKENAKSYVLLAVVIIGLGSLTAALIIRLTGIDSAMGIGIWSGALTTTPGFAAAQEALADNEGLLQELAVGHAIGYPYGVVGVVLFVQIIPRLLKADMGEEHKKLGSLGTERAVAQLQGLYEFDPFGFGAFAMAVCLGIILGKVSIPLPGGAAFSLGNTGGILIMGLIFSHLGHIGKLSLQARGTALETFREYGLMMFLIGAGVPGGAGFVRILEEQDVILFVYGALMTTIPMIAGYFVAGKALKLDLLNNLGSITGGMTSTPALGTLINVAGSNDVAAAYAATYPGALVLIVLACQFIVTL